MAEALSELVPHDRLTLYLAESPIRSLRPALGDAAIHGLSATEVVPFGEGLIGRAAETREPQLSNPGEPPSGSSNDGGDKESRGESVLALPLLAHSDLKGVLSLSREGDRPFSLKELKLAVLFGDLAALAIDDAQVRATLETEVVTDHLTGLHNHRFFQERLAEELGRAHRRGNSVGLVMYDIDDFKRVNDSYGHQMGDRVLQSVAAVSRETCRAEDVICRIGGEEFGIILPGSSVIEALALAERLREGIAKVALPPVGRITVSLGVAEGPLHASSARELITCSDFALLDAKDRGKDRVQVYVPRSLTLENGASNRPAKLGRGKPSKRYGSGTGMDGRLAELAARGEPRAVAQLRMLQSLSTKLNRLNDVNKIGEVITAEVRSLIDYQNCRVHLLEPDGKTLTPVGFRGELLEYQKESFPALVIHVGQGVTGHVAETGEPYYAPNAREDPFAKEIPRRAEVDESILGVPLTIGDQIIGTIVLAKLGLDQFDSEDMRLLQGLASTAAVALENARLLEREREATKVATALLGLSERLTRVTDTQLVMSEALKSVPELLGCADVGIWLYDRNRRVFRLLGHEGFDGPAGSKRGTHEVPWDVAEPFVTSADEPFVIPSAVAETFPQEYRLVDSVGDVLVAPLRWPSDGLGALVVVASDDSTHFAQKELQLARGIAGITSLALGNAARFVELEETYVSTVAALANALDAQDEYTGSHARALAEMTVTVGADMGLDGESLKRLELASLFHDIGKIGVPSEIIRKDGSLTAAERRHINRHPEIGEQILSPVPFLQPLLPIVRGCHERWDGKGYPDGLAGDAIPLEARIIFVCDAFHAMTTDRPYRNALSQTEAIRRLKLAAGRQFDPTV
ncbi:MAG TPA: diguanylate cyclase, partial [Actinomycetota bacterium]